MATASEPPAKSQRFADLSASDYEELLSNKDSKNTQKSTKIAANLLRDYLREKNSDINFEDLDKSSLAAILAKFYVEVRKRDGDFYKISSLLSIRQGLNRHLKKPDGKEVRIIDIIKDVELLKPT